MFSVEDGNKSNQLFNVLDDHQMQIDSFLSTDQDSGGG